eukprot:GHRQ01022401.1.p1 GENE.GHRQ01022401.1~~GHRQ01022401.1.p1  ORF type:complete len:122 (-),score=0.87 GHRQ01022401.1:576-941(-)
MLSVALGITGLPGSGSPTCVSDMKALLANLALIVSLQAGVRSKVNWGKHTPTSWFLLLPSELLSPVSTNSALTASNKHSSVSRTSAPANTRTACSRRQYGLRTPRPAAGNDRPGPQGFVLQ